jgi:transcriptional regulator with XRE-family HTH domain
MHIKETFGEVIRRLREERGLPIRKVAAILDIDPSTLSKVERGERTANKEFISKLADLFSVDESGLMVDFLSDKVSYELMLEEHSLEVLKVAEQKIQYRRSKNVSQGELGFDKKEDNE